MIVKFNQTIWENNRMFLNALIHRCAGSRFWHVVDILEWVSRQECRFQVRKKYPENLTSNKWQQLTAKLRTTLTYNAKAMIFFLMFFLQEFTKRISGFLAFVTLNIFPEWIDILLPCDRTTACAN